MKKHLIFKDAGCPCTKSTAYEDERLICRDEHNNQLCIDAPGTYHCHCPCCHGNYIVTVESAD